MDDDVLTNAGRWMLDRRNFLRWGGTGLSSIALAALLRDQRLLASESPILPKIDPANPYARRLPHFAPKAKRVLVVFCSGALSHLDTFDYKPELVKRHDTPMAGSGEKLITFQGENGNLIQPQWEFRPRGQSGKMTSELLPRLGELVDEICFIHSMTAKSNTHGPAESQMSTGFTLDGFPSMGAWVSYALGSACQDLPAFVAIHAGCRRLGRVNGRPLSSPLPSREPPSMGIARSRISRDRTGLTRNLTRPLVSLSKRSTSDTLPRIRATLISRHG